jgi:hypothetical protein
MSTAHKSKIFTLRYEDVELQQLTSKCSSWVESLDGDPVSDLTALQRMSHVFKAGVVTARRPYSTRFEARWGCTEIRNFSVRVLCSFN